MFTTKIVATAMLSGSLAWGWSAEGHRAVGDIAQAQLVAKGTFDAIGKLLGNLTLAQLATCPDELKESLMSKTYKVSDACASVFPKPYPTGTNNWHYVNMSVALDSATAKDVAKACGKACATSKSDAFGKILADPKQPAAARLQALSWIVHFIGDIHQPLHAAIRDNDGGGNSEIVRLGKASGALHHMWDGPLVSAINADDKSLAAALSNEIAAALTEPASQPVDWVIASWNLAKTVAYPPIPPANGETVVATLDGDYQTNATPVIRKQIARGGVHLAQYLTDHMPKQ